jgi:hypothetical protein
MKRARTLCAALAAVAFAAFAAAPSSALATPDEPFALVESFDGAATPDGSMEVGGVVVNRATGHLLVVDKAHSAVVQFDESGNPVKFSGLPTAKRSIPAPGQIFIDNSSGPTQGDFYVLHQNVNVEGFAPSGEKLPGWPVAANTSVGSLFTIAVDQNGMIWFSYLNQNESFIEQHDVTGGSTGLKINGTAKPEERMDATEAAFDSHGNLYYGAGDGFGVDGEIIYRRDAAENYFPRHVLNDQKTKQLAVDPSTDDLYVSHVTSITANHYTEQVGTDPPFETLPGLQVAGFDFSQDGQTLFEGEGTKVNVFKRQPPRVPVITEPLDFVGVKSRGSFASGLVDTGGGAPANYAFEFASAAEWETAPGAYGRSFPTPAYALPHTTFGLQGFSSLLDGLEPLTAYHVRLAVTNKSGTGYSPDAILRTLPAGDSGGVDNCANALARKQTRANALPDCRAYELVSAAYAGGFDVESPMVPGQQPFAGYPSADGRLLYGVHAGIVPGPWNPTNNGVDPYVAVRGADGWTTEYVGLPAEISPTKSRFSSALGGADADLHTFAFAGPGLCDPCFTETPETGIPLREPNGQLIQAMVGDNAPASNIKPEGRVAKMVSANGNHVIFGSQSPLVDGANASGGNLNIFDRDLGGKTTQLVSTDPGGAAIHAGADVSELGLSDDGSRVLIGTKVSADAAGNEYALLYMHLGTSPNSVALTPGFNGGVVFAGMTDDGSKVFFISREKLLSADDDTAADLYETAVGPTGTVTLSLLTPKAGGSCDPVANKAGAHWNTVDASADCGAVAIGGGAGVASANGAVFLLSPEILDGSEGAADQPNLYEILAGGNPEFVATLSPDDPLVVGSTRNADASAATDLQTTPDGAFAGFRSILPLTGVANAGKTSVFLFSRGAADPLACVSCNPTLTEDPTQQGEATLAGNGLTISDDGRLFFNTAASLGVEDTGGTKDVYEWIGGRPRLISSGIGRFDSELLTVTHDGTDAFFFTHDTLDAKADENGERTKIYDARVGGGLFALPRAPGCRASDECHGPGTIAPGPPQIGSSGPTSDGNNAVSKGCPKGKVKKHGKCVKKAQKKHGKKHAKKGKKHHG